MNKRLVIVLLSLAAGVATFLLVGKKGGLTGGFDPLEALASKPRGVVVVPELGRLGEKLAFLPKLKVAQLAGSLAGMGDPEALASGVGQQVGFDVRNRQLISAVGIDPGKPLYAEDAPDGAELAAIPLADAQKFGELVARHALNRLNAPKRAEVPGMGATIVTFSTEGTPAPQLAYAVKGGYAILSAGPDPVGAVSNALSRKKEASLSSDERFKAMAGRMTTSDAWLFLGESFPELTRLNFAYGAGAGLSISESELKLGVEVPLAGGQAEEFKGLTQSAGKELLNKLDAEAFLVIHLGSDFSALAPRVNAMLPGMVLALLKDAEIDLGEELANLKPGVAASVSLAPTAELSSMPSLDPRATNPFKYLYLSALGQVKDPKKAFATMEKIVKVGPRFGSFIEGKDESGARVYTSRYHLGEGASFALVGEAVAVSGGEGRMPLLLQRLTAPSTSFEIKEPAAKKAVDDSAVAVYLDLARLVASIRDLPSSTYGVGGFAIRAAVSRWLDSIDEIGSIRVTAGLAEQSLRGEVAVTLRKPPANAAATP